MLEKVRFVVGDAAWEKVAPLLPGKACDPGATARDNRLFLEAGLWRGRNGAPHGWPPRGCRHGEEGLPRLPRIGAEGGVRRGLRAPAGGEELRERPGRT